jgi:hypothetical protein
MRSHTLRTVTALALALAAASALAAPAVADEVYHSEHLRLAPVGDAPLRSGFVENIKAQGPNVYAHEIFVLNGAGKNASYTVSRNFFLLDPGCDGDGFSSVVAVLKTTAAGNARADLVVHPAEVAGFEGVHGVRWTVQNAAGAIVYRTRCATVTLD